jgi:Subtilase family
MDSSSLFYNRLKNQKGRLTSHWLAPTFLGTLMFLTGCGMTQISTDQSGYPYVLTLKVTATDNMASLESKYSGKVQVFHPEAGFAVLGVNSAPAADSAVLGFEANNGNLELPESKSTKLPRVVGSESWSTWGSSWTTWGSSWTTWGSSWTTWGSGSSTTTLPAMPNENRYLWNLTRLPSAQAVSKNFGTGAKIAVIDSGIDLTHPAFAGRLAASTEWKDFVDGDAVPQEVSGGNGYGHGTFISSVILQVAPKATILPIRVLAPDGSGSETAVISGIDWAIQKGAQIINLSLGATTDNVALEAEIDYATSLGVYVVVSAGNNGSASLLTYPAQRATTAPNEKYLISVGSVASTSLLSIFSNISPALEITAPGEFIFGALPGNAAGYGSGTSFAAPQISGLLALLMMDTASANRANLQKYLLDSADPYPGGYSMVSMAYAMQKLPDFKFKKAFMVVGSTTLNVGDAAIKYNLERLGYTVSLKTGAAALSTDATGKDLILISSTVTPTDVNTKFRTVSAPVIVWESSLYDDMGMVDLQANTGISTSENYINVSGTHPLTAGLLPLMYASYTSADMVNWGKPASTAIKVATLSSNSNLATIFAYDKGTQMVGMTAPGRRVALMLGDNGASKLGWAGGLLGIAAITWAVSGN